MTGPRPDFLETLRQMAQKPDATSTPDPKGSFDDLIRQLTGGGTVSNRYEGLRPAIPVSQSAMPDYIGGPAGAEGAAAKLAAEMPSGQPDLLGALKRLGHSKPAMPSILAPQQGPLMQARQDAIESLRSMLAKVNKDARVPIESRASSAGGSATSVADYWRQVEAHTAALDKRSDAYFRLKAIPEWDSAARDAARAEWKQLGVEADKIRPKL